MRLFIGIPLPKAITAELATWVSRQETPLKLKWTDPYNYHITLLFLGEVDESLIPDINKALERVVQQFTTSTLTFEKLQFKPQNSPRMIWAKYKANSSLIQLQQAIAQALINHAYYENRLWIPHVTLARFYKKPLAIQQHLDFKSADFTVHQFVLYQSEMSGGKTHYIPLNQFKLKVK
tara:strand:+ start:384 stop:917 length:534 start_codon:yes stop_codon:yes gene_type:complete